MSRVDGGKDSSTTYIALGGALKEIEQLKERIKDLEVTASKVRHLELCNKIFIGILTLLGSALVRFFWNNPELWKQLVERLK